MDEESTYVLSQIQWTCKFTCIYVYYFKVAFDTKGSIFYEPMSQYGDLNILRNCFYSKHLSYISVAQWSKALV